MNLNLSGSNAKQHFSAGAFSIAFVLSASSEMKGIQPWVVEYCCGYWECQFPSSSCSHCLCTTELVSALWTRSYHLLTLCVPNLRPCIIAAAIHAVGKACLESADDELSQPDQFVRDTARNVFGRVRRKQASGIMMSYQTAFNFLTNCQSDVVARGLFCAAHHDSALVGFDHGEDEVAELVVWLRLKGTAVILTSTLLDWMNLPAAIDAYPLLSTPNSAQAR